MVDATPAPDPFELVARQVAALVVVSPRAGQYSPEQWVHLENAWRDVRRLCRADDLGRLFGELRRWLRSGLDDESFGEARREVDEAETAVGVAVGGGLPEPILGCEYVADDGSRTPCVMLPTNAARGTQEALAAAWAAVERLERWRDCRKEDGGAPPTAATTPPPLPTIWSHGGRSYSRDGHTPYVVSHDCNSLLTAFADAGTVAMDTATIEKRAGVTNVARVVRELQEAFGGLFADAIRTPDGKRGQGGYFIRVRPAA